MAIEKEIVDQLLAGRDAQELFGKDGLVEELKKALSERILNTELDEHLGEERSEGNANRRNGSSQKTVLTGTSKMRLSIPRDRAGTFDPKLIARYQRRFPDFDDKIISMYARGMSVREIRGHLEELYGIDVSPDLISAVTDAVLEEVAEWQGRPLEACYPLVFFDAIRVKIRDEGFVRNKAVYIALAILADGSKAILGLWIEQTEGAKFWLRVMNELKNDHHRVPRRGRPDMHRASDPSLATVRVMEGPQAGHAGAQGDLPGQRCRGRPQGPGGVRVRPVGPEIPGHRDELAAQLGACGAVLCLPRSRPPHHLHHQCH
jgi:putative transposase